MKNIRYSGECNHKRATCLQKYSHYRVKCFCLLCH